MDVTTVNKNFTLLPPAPGHCPVCAVAHEPEQPHNSDSLFYQLNFYHEHNRWPTWADAMAHCTPETKAAWVKGLAERGINVDGQ